MAWLCIKSCLWTHSLNRLVQYPEETTHKNNSTGNLLSISVTGNFYLSLLLEVLQHPTALGLSHTPRTHVVLWSGLVITFHGLNRDSASSAHTGPSSLHSPPCPWRFVSDDNAACAPGFPRAQASWRTLLVSILRSLSLADATSPPDRDNTQQPPTHPADLFAWQACSWSLCTLDTLEDTFYFHSSCF